MADWLWIYLVLITGACLQSVIGFGLGLLCAPILFLISPALVPAPMILNALLLTLLISIRNRDAIHLKQTSFSILGGTAGVLTAGVVMLFLEPHQYRLLFGISIILAVLLSVVGIKPTISIISNLVASMLSGFMGTTTSAGGAPMGLLYQTAEHRQIKANLSVFFLYINSLGIIVLWLTGAADFADLTLFLQCVPAILIGWLLSALVNNRINSDAVRVLILLVALFSGIASILM
ncbi:sulfite exporter TauE/SafE family protein [Bowmanella dokdonensis]|uniref:Probable membrane transporter protein n=1 Tax=Bowmanella dokdonensis TaxID=751969 RepID=A0A939DT13_9ALTE|nr:sulfite exporter TauE/SafE family protein [Bowmanella dokdonensis]MBN7827381.1 sulfite exporter TauE/SafE family protein [Bowmanella dokdonensis]